MGGGADAFDGEGDGRRDFLGTTFARFDFIHCLKEGDARLLIGASCQFGDEARAAVDELFVAG